MNFFVATMQLEMIWLDYLLDKERWNWNSGYLRMWVEIEFFVWHSTDLIQNSLDLLFTENSKNILFLFYLTLAVTCQVLLVSQQNGSRLYLETVMYCHIWCKVTASNHCQSSQTLKCFEHMKSCCTNDSKNYSPLDVILDQNYGK